MDAQLKTKWVEALRSGKIKQARGQLKKGNAFCCLGVLCGVAGLRIDESGNGLLDHERGLNPYDPIFKIVGGIDKSHSLSMRNDGCWEDEKQWSFPEIADWIEANIPADAAAFQDAESRG